MKGKMKMTKEIPPGIATPDTLQTRLGTLNLFDGAPDKETAQKVYDNLDFQRGVQAYWSSIQIASIPASSGKPQERKEKDQGKKPHNAGLGRQ